jgi:ribose/xylose/arabinose/galactoside ABC-type transport system permease subunit
MAKVFGAAGEHAGQQSVAAFKRMFLTVLIVAIVAALCEGVVVTTFIIKRGGIAAFVLTLTIGLFLFWLLRRATRRIEMHETERLNWRRGR